MIAGGTRPAQTLHRRYVQGRVRARADKSWLCVGGYVAGSPRGRSTHGAVRMQHCVCPTQARTVDYPAMHFFRYNDRRCGIYAQAPLRWYNDCRSKTQWRHIVNHSKARECDNAPVQYQSSKRYRCSARFAEKAIQAQQNTLSGSTR
jgi:hypothetical protein